LPPDMAPGQAAPPVLPAPQPVLPQPALTPAGYQQPVRIPAQPPVPQPPLIAPGKPSRGLLAPWLEGQNSTTTHKPLGGLLAPWLERGNNTPTPKEANPWDRLKRRW
jgi:hypothetical protein